MAWSTPSTVVDGQVMNAATWNQEVRDNIGYLMTQNNEEYEDTSTATAYSTTSTSFVAVDGTNLNLSLTTHGGPVMVSVECIITAGSGVFVYLDVEVDGVRVGDVDNGIMVTTGGAYQVNLALPLFGLSADTHTIKLVYKAHSGTAYLRTLATGTVDYYSRIYFAAREG